MASCLGFCSRRVANYYFGPVAAIDPLLLIGPLLSVLVVFLFFKKKDLDSKKDLIFRLWFVLVAIFFIQIFNPLCSGKHFCGDRWELFYILIPALWFFLGRTVEHTTLRRLFSAVTYFGDDSFSLRIDTSHQWI